MFLDDFFSTRFNDFYREYYISIVNSPLLLLTDYFKELHSKLPDEYSFEQSSLTGVDLEDEDLMMYHDKKSYFFELLGKCDLILLVAGLYDLKSNDYYIDFLMENDSSVKFDDEYGDAIIPKVQISRKSFSVLAFQWQGLLMMHYKVKHLQFSFVELLC